MAHIGKYELISFLGEGATAEVHHARDTVLGREVALKLLKPSLVTDSSAFARFTLEARAAAILFHPQIATVFEMGEADGRYFIAMRYVSGKSLHDWIKSNGSLSWEETLKMTSQIGAALDYAHREGFLHRDVKPGNILRSEQGDYVLTDFGLTRAMMATGMTSHTGAILGTPSYIAPEIWDGKESVPATDQYALACVIYEALTGKILFDGNTPIAVLTKHVAGAQIPERWAGQGQQDLTYSLLRALRKDPTQRFGSMQEMIVSLTNVEGAAQESLPITGKVQTKHETPAENHAPIIPPPSQTISSLPQNNEKHPTKNQSPGKWLPWAGLGCAGLIILLLVILLFRWGLQLASPTPADTSPITVVVAINEIPATPVPSYATNPSETESNQTSQNNTEAFDATQTVVVLTSVAAQELAATTNAQGTDIAQIAKTVEAQNALQATANAQPTSAPPTNVPTPTLIPTKTYEVYYVNVPATQKWVYTGIMLQANQTIEISAVGLWTNTPDKEPYGPVGYGTSSPNSIKPDAGWGTLIGRIGSGSIFVIGNSITLKVSTKGELVLTMNDSQFTDNSGSMSVTIIVYP